MSSGNINSGDLIGALIAQKDNFVDGIRYAQSKIEGTMSLIILTKNSIIAARDAYGRLPIIVGKRWDGYCLSTESFAFQKLGYETFKELQAGEIVKITSDGCEILAEGDSSKMKVCTFLWTYYGYPTACYEGVNVEVMRTRNGEIMAENDRAISAPIKSPEFMFPLLMVSKFAQPFCKSSSTRTSELRIIPTEQMA